MIDNRTTNLGSGNGNGHGPVRPQRPLDPIRPGGWRAALASLRAAPAALFVVPLLVFVAIAGLSIWAWQARRSAERSGIQHDTELLADAMSNHFLSLIREDIQQVRRLVKDLTSDKLQNPSDFISLANPIDSPSASMRVTLWIGTDGLVKVAAPVATAGKLAGKPARDIKGCAAGLDRAPNGKTTLAFSNRGGSPSLWIVSGAVVTPRGPDSYRGTIARELDLGARAAEMLPVSADGTRRFEIDVLDQQGRLVFASNPDLAGEWAAVRYIQPLSGHFWTLRLRPSPAFVAARTSTGPRYLLQSGILVALLASAALAQAIHHRRRERVRSDEHRAALQAVSKVSASISDQPAGSLGVLRDLADEAARLMNMSMTTITLYDSSENTMRVVHLKNQPSPPRDLYQLDELPLSKGCMESRRVLAVGDVDGPGSPFAPGHMSRWGIRSLLLLPLMVRGAPMGVIMLADGKPRQFTELDRCLAELWTMEAAVTLSHRTMYERMNGALQSLRHILDQRETLYEVNSSIHDADTLRESLDRIAELAPKALDADACIVVLPTECRSDNVRIAALTAGPPRGMEPDAVVTCHTCATVMRSGENLIVQDTASLKVRGFPEMGSALFVPMKGDGKQTVGLLVLLRRRRGPFDPDLVRMAEVFASRAAAALESARLHEQTRRQAESNAILLRELNHRVKNNLASIVGLLSMAPSDLPEEARQWLDRAIERVTMIARAHDLFSGGVQAVGLQDLVKTALASVSPLKGPDVHIQIDLRAVDVPLSSARAVTLAMVLYELASNALEHALGEGGELTVRGRRLSEHRIAIDVVDSPAVAVAVGVGAGTDDSGDGPHAPSEVAEPAPALSYRRGLGLMLVNNLVSRELRGVFSVGPADEGGTVATVEFSTRDETNS